MEALSLRASRMQRHEKAARGSAIAWALLQGASPWIADLPGGARRAARMRQISRSDRVFSQGDTPRSMFVVISGEVHLVRRSPSGAEIILQKARHGVVAEASFDQSSYHCDAIAALTSELLEIPMRSFAEALSDDAFRSRWIGHLSRELRRVRVQVERLGLKTAEERIVHFIETEGAKGAVRLTGTRKAWAAELGLTHEALYRALSRMQRARLLVIDGPAIALRR